MYPYKKTIILSLLTLTYSTGVSLPTSLNNSNKLLECPQANEITKKNISFGKFVYTAKIPNTDITLQSEPIYRWVTEEATSFMKDSIVYARTEDIINCIYMTDADKYISSEQKRLNRIDLKHDIFKQYTLYPYQPDVWIKSKSKVECDKKPVQCAVEEKLNS